LPGFFEGAEPIRALLRAQSLFEPLVELLDVHEEAHDHAASTHRRVEGVEPALAVIEAVACQGDVRGGLCEELGHDDVRVAGMTRACIGSAPDELESALRARALRQDAFEEEIERPGAELREGSERRPESAVT